MSNDTGNLYQPGQTFFHGLDPRTKLLWVMGITTIAFLFFNPLVSFSICTLNFVLLYLSTGRYALKNPISNAVLFMSLSQIIVHGCVNVVGVTPVILLGYEIAIPFLGVLKWEGVSVGAIYAFRLLGVGYAALLFIATTHPRDLVKGFEKLGLPFKYGFMILMSLQLIPETIRETKIILDAQQSRGVKMKSITERLRALLPVFVPITIGSMQRVQMMSMALEARAYGAPVERTELRVLRLRRSDFIIFLVITIMIITGLYFYLYLTI